MIAADFRVFGLAVAIAGSLDFEVAAAATVVAGLHTCLVGLGPDVMFETAADL